MIPTKMPASHFTPLQFASMGDRVLRAARIPAVLLLLAAQPAVFRGDEIYLKNGNKVTGEVIRENSREIVYERNAGEYTLPRSLVERIVRAAPGDLPVAHAASSERPEVPLPVLQPLDYPADPALMVIRNNALDESQLQRLDDDVLHEPSEDTRRRLALGYLQAGAFLARAGRPDRAIDLYRHALQLAPSDLGLTVSLGYALVTEKHFNQAVELLVPASDEFPQSPDVPLLLGSAYYYTENLDRAIAEWRLSLKLHDDPRVREALARAEQEREVAGSYQEIRSLHFLLRYQGSEARPLAEEVLKALDADFLDLQSALDVYPRETIVVLLYPDQAFKDITRLPSWVGAENDGKIRIPVSGLTSVTPDLGRVLKHELTHSFVHQVTRGRCPTWFNEGLAQMEEGPASPATAALLARAASSGQSLPFEKLETSFISLPPEQVGLAYVKSLAALLYLRDTYGMIVIRRLLKMMPTTPDFSSLLQNELRMDYPTLGQKVAVYAEGN